MPTGRQFARFRKQLLAWFRQFQRDLPWRRDKDSYHVWLSEIMLQQTRVTAVIPYFEKFLERFPDMRALAEAPQEEVLRLWSGLGYYSRARNLQKASQEIVAKHGGKFPDKLENALALSGVGVYTAAAILSIAHGEELAVLDGNVARVLARLDVIRGDLWEPKRWQELQRKADLLLDRGSPGDWNQAMMELGATICTPRAPQCLLCPVASSCEARKLGIAESLPEKRRKRKPVSVLLAAAVFIDVQGRTLLLPPPRVEEGINSEGAADHVPTLVSKMWHFPTISVGENPERELMQALQRLSGGKARAIELRPVAKVRHAVTYRNITILPFRASCTKLPSVTGTTVVPLDDLSSVPVSNLTRKVATSALADCRDKRLANGKATPHAAASRAAIAGYR